MLIKSERYANPSEIIYHWITFPIRRTPTTIKLICHIQLCSHLKTHNADPFALFLPLLFIFCIPATFNLIFVYILPFRRILFPALYAKETAESQLTNERCYICTGAFYSLMVFGGIYNVNWDDNDDKMFWQIKIYNFSTPFLYSLILLSHSSFESEKLSEFNYFRRNFK